MAKALECPPLSKSRKFNENDILGDFDRDEKGNVKVGEPTPEGKYFDKQGRETNGRGYLIEPASGDVINNLDGAKMFPKSEMDQKDEVPAPFNIEKHNFNPHSVRGDFDYDRKGKAMVLRDKHGKYVDKNGVKVSKYGYRVDSAGNLIDQFGRKKLDKNQMTDEGNIPKLFNYNGRRFDINDVTGICEKDKKGNIVTRTDKKGRLVDKLARPINKQGYLIDASGNVVDKDGKLVFEKHHLLNDEIPKIFQFSKMNIKSVLGDFEMDPIGNPVLDKNSKGDLVDKQGKRVNAKGYLVDSQGNVVNQNGKVMFPKSVLDPEGDIPKVYRTGLLKSESESSLSRLMSEIEKNGVSDFEDAPRGKSKPRAGRSQNKNPAKRHNSGGDTSEGSMMGETPADYNLQNQRFEAEMGQSMDDDEEYGSQYEGVGLDGMSGMGSNHGGAGLAKRKKKKKKKKKKVKPVEMEDPSLREMLLAGAYGGVAQPKPKR